MDKYYVKQWMTPMQYASQSSMSNMNDWAAVYRASDVDARIAELERRLKRINAINDNPARFDTEIDELSTLGKEGVR